VRLDGSDGNWISLTVLGYEFPDKHNDVFDSNWLIIDGEVLHNGLHWTFQEPSLLAGEGLHLLSWLGQLADAEEPITSPDSSDPLWPDLYFTEPNLAFSVASREDSLVVLRVHLSLESAPPVPDAADRFDIYQFFIDLPMTTMR
jgi:hypothetical protein